MQRQKPGRCGQWPQVAELGRSVDLLTSTLNDLARWRTAVISSRREHILNARGLCAERSESPQSHCQVRRFFSPTPLKNV
jgi:hypothetical protein